MTMRFKENDEETEWTTGKYLIRKAKMSSRHDVYVYHCYHDDLYIAQRGKLGEAKEACEQHREENRNK